MAALDFREIPPAHTGLDRDAFELFARSFLIHAGFKILQDPDRGADDGRDLIVEERRSGPAGTSVIRWLVSCKHKAHSGNSVAPADESNVRDRLGTHRCHGFIAFYSTLPSSGLSSILNGLRPDFEYFQLDAEAIEKSLLDNPTGRAIASRFMPVSFAKWMRASEAVAANRPAPDPHHSFHRFFLREPHADLATANTEAVARKLPLFVVIFDPDHPSHSKIDFSLGCFMEYQTTKKLVDQHFVAVIGASKLAEFAALVPNDNPLENCLWVVLTTSGEVLRCEGVYANPDEGLLRVRSVIASLST